MTIGRCKKGTRGDRKGVQEGGQEEDARRTRKRDNRGTKEMQEGNKKR